MKGQGLMVAVLSASLALAVLVTVATPNQHTSQGTQTK